MIDAVKGILRKESADRLRDVYLIGDIEKDVARLVIERLRELANDNSKPITLYINSAGGNGGPFVGCHCQPDDADAEVHASESLPNRLE